MATVRELREQISRSRQQLARAEVRVKPETEREMRVRQLGIGSMLERRKKEKIRKEIDVKRLALGKYEKEVETYAKWEAEAPQRVAAAREAAKREFVKKYPYSKKVYGMSRGAYEQMVEAGQFGEITGRRTESYYVPKPISIGAYSPAAYAKLIEAGIVEGEIKSIKQISRDPSRTQELVSVIDIASGVATEKQLQAIGGGLSISPVQILTQRERLSGLEAVRKVYQEKPSDVLISGGERLTQKEYKVVLAEQRTPIEQKEITSYKKWAEEYGTIEEKRIARQIPEEIPYREVGGFFPLFTKEFLPSMAEKERELAKETRKLPELIGTERELKKFYEDIKRGREKIPSWMKATWADPAEKVVVSGMIAGYEGVRKKPLQTLTIMGAATAITLVGGWVVGTAAPVVMTFFRPTITGVVTKALEPVTVSAVQTAGQTVLPAYGVSYVERVIDEPTWIGRGAAMGEIISTEIAPAAVGSLFAAKVLPKIKSITFKQEPPVTELYYKEIPKLKTIGVGKQMTFKKIIRPIRGGYVERPGTTTVGMKYISGKGEYILRTITEKSRFLGIGKPKFVVKEIAVTAESYAPLKKMIDPFTGLKGGKKGLRAAYYIETTPKGISTGETFISGQVRTFKTRILKTGGTPWEAKLGKGDVNVMVRSKLYPIEGGIKSEVFKGPALKKMTAQQIIDITGEKFAVGQGRIYGFKTGTLRPTGTPATRMLSVTSRERGVFVTRVFEPKVSSVPGYDVVKSKYVYRSVIEARAGQTIQFKTTPTGKIIIKRETIQPVFIEGKGARIARIPSVSKDIGTVMDFRGRIKIPGKEKIIQQLIKVEKIVPTTPKIISTKPIDIKQVAIQRAKEESLISAMIKAGTREAFLQPVPISPVIEKVSVRGLTALSIIPLVRAEPYQRPVSLPLVSQQPFSLSIQQPVILPVQQPMILPTQMPIQQPIQVPIQQPIQIPIQVPIQQPIQIPIQVPIQQPIQIPIQVPVQVPIQEPIIIPPPPTPSTPFLKETKKPKIKIVKAFQPFVKRRGEWIRIGMPQPKAKAIKLGERIARITLAAAFRIRHKGYVPHVPEEHYLPSPKVFREYKIIRGVKVPLKEEWIQRRKYRLSTRLEVREIQRARKKFKREKIKRRLKFI